MDERTSAALFDEMEKIGFLPGIGGFLRGGWSALKGLGSTAGRATLMGEAKALPGNLSRAWKSGGWRQAGKVLQHSAPVQAGAMGLGGLYVGGKLLGAGGRMLGGQQQPQQGYYR